jgi:aerobic C4-dicarboxylate transport protein
LNSSKKIHHLYIQVLAAISLGILLGHFYPETAVKMKPLGDGFIKFVKMIIAPIIFCTVVTGIAGAFDRLASRACRETGRRYEHRCDGFR